jgi:hypothetical protein
MFDKYVLPQVREEHHHRADITVNHHHAPTDKSVELLNEFQKKAIDNLISKFEIKGNTLEACLIVLGHDYDGGRTLLTRFKLNGKEYKFEEKFEYGDFILLTQQELGQKLIQKFSEAIALELVKQSSKDWMQYFFKK